MTAEFLTLAVNEIFGPTFQGEGKYAGRRCAFLRLAGCNLSCSWCDTPYTWDWKGKNGIKFDARAETHKMTLKEVAAQLMAMKCAHIVVTGGEPMLQQKALTRLFLGAPLNVEIETNGTLAPEPDLVTMVYHFDVSPKLPSSGQNPDHRNLWKYAASNKASFKFVVTSVLDLIDVDALIARWLPGLSRSKVYIMPEGKTAADVLAHGTNIAQAVLDKGYNLTLRQHVLLWENERAR